MPVYKLVEEMPYDEYLKWGIYFEKRPVGWRDDSRTHTLLQAQGVKAKPYEIFSSLVPIYSASTEGLEDGMISSQNLRRSNIFGRLVNSVKGDDVRKALNA